MLCCWYKWLTFYNLFRAWCRTKQGDFSSCHGKWNVNLQPSSLDLDGKKNVRQPGHAFCTRVWTTMFLSKANNFSPSAQRNKLLAGKTGWRKLESESWEIIHWFTKFSAAQIYGLHAIQRATNDWEKCTQMKDYRCRGALWRLRAYWIRCYPFIPGSSRHAAHELQIQHRNSPVISLIPSAWFWLQPRK